MYSLLVGQKIKINGSIFKVIEDKIKINKEPKNKEQLDKYQKIKYKAFWKYVLLDEEEKYVYWLIVNEEEHGDEFYLFSHFENDIEDYEYEELEKRIVLDLVEAENASDRNNQTLTATNNTYSILELDNGEIICVEYEFLKKNVGFGREVKSEEIEISNEYDKKIARRFNDRSLFKVLFKFTKVIVEISIFIISIVFLGEIFS